MSSAPEERPLDETPAPVNEVEAILAPVEVEHRVASRTWTFDVPTRTVPLLMVLTSIGTIVLAFTLWTVQRGNRADLTTNPGAERTNFSIRYWIEHGYFDSSGLAVRPSYPSGIHYYITSTGGHLVSGFAVMKIYRAMTGRDSRFLLAVHNQVITMLGAALLGLLAFRLAQRIGALPLHAFVLAVAVEVLHFTFPDSLLAYWEMTGRPWFFMFAAVFLLIDEQAIDRRTTNATVAQAVVAFLMVYLEVVATIMFLASYLVAAAVLRHRLTSRRVIATILAPVALAYGLYQAQLLSASVRHPEIPFSGSSFMFRSGLDGSSQYYGDHLDIARQRDVARGNFKYNRQYLFRWKWLFFSGTAALLLVLVLAALGRVPAIATIALLSFTGTYTLYGAVFSQGFVIHPYLFDVLLVTPLLLALFCVAPATLESLTSQRGVAVAAIFFLTIWVMFVQLRRFALWYPPAETIAKTNPQP